MKHLITGSKGFIGSHLTRTLIGMGDSVIEVDVKNGISCQGMNVSLGGVEYVWHLASPTGSFRNDPLVAWNTVTSTHAAIEAALVVGAKMILFSDAEVCEGGTEKTPISLSPPILPRTQFIAGKLASEVMVLTTPGLEAQVLRISNVAGRGQNADLGFVLARWGAQIKKMEPLTVFYDGSAQRSFLSIRDLVKFCLTLKDNWPVISQVWNVANPKNETTIKALAKKIARQAGVEVHYVQPSALGFKGYVEGRYSPLVVGKAKNKLGWKAEVGLGEIVDEVVRG